MRAMLFTIGLLLFAGGCEPSTPLTPEQKAISERQAQESQEETEIVFAAEKVVKEFLKWPHDASFSFLPEVRFNDNRTAASVQGTVKAKNTFGAELTHEYLVLFVKESVSWQVETISIGNEVVYRKKQTTESLPPDKSKPSSSPPMKRLLPDPELRTWASDDFSGEATFISMAMGKVKLKKPSGEIVIIPLEKLSQEDQHWIRKRGQL
jgi:hypothetical protein